MSPLKLWEFVGFSITTLSETTFPEENSGRSPTSPSHQLRLSNLERTPPPRGFETFFANVAADPLVQVRTRLAGFRAIWWRVPGGWWKKTPLFPPPKVSNKRFQRLLLFVTGKKPHFAFLTLKSSPFFSRSPHFFSSGFSAGGPKLRSSMVEWTWIKTPEREELEQTSAWIRSAGKNDESAVKRKIKVKDIESPKSYLRLCLILPGTELKFMHRWHRRSQTPAYCSILIVEKLICF